jgi:hypothetical protein
MEMTRRQLLGGGALLLAGYAGAMAFGRRPWWGESPCLGATARRTLEAAFEALLDDDEAARTAADGVDRFLADGDPVAASGLWTALLLLEGTASWGTSGFSRLAREDRIGILASWENSSWAVRRQVFQALRRTAVFSHYANPATWEAIGYDGPWVGR